LEQAQADFVKKTITLPDGRYMVLYDFAPIPGGGGEAKPGPNAAPAAKEQ
jgi:hypothetical protein